jgi:uncharacterized CHY-type Zn-finger protein
MGINSAICGHCGQDISAQFYQAYKLRAWPVCEARSPDPYCPRTKEHYPNPPEMRDEDPEAEPES